MKGIKRVRKLHLPRLKGTPGELRHEWPEYVETVHIFPCASFVCVVMPILM